MFVNLRIASACETFLPRTRSITSLAFLGEPFRYFAFAIASIFFVNRFVTARTALTPSDASIHIYFLRAIFSAFVPGWPLNILVGENSPSLCPTMFSVTYTGMWRLPLCTPKVNPTISGVIVERRDQVLIACGLAPLSCDLPEHL